MAIVFDMISGEILEETPRREAAPSREARQVTDLPQTNLQIIEIPQPAPRQCEIPEELVNVDVDAFLQDMDGQASHDGKPRSPQN